MKFTTVAPTEWEDIDGKKIYTEDILESICSKTPVKVIKYNNEFCIRNKIGEIIPIRNLQHSLKHSNRLLLRKRGWING